MTVRIITGDCRTALTDLPDGSVHCCVTSPPYFGLRDYEHPDQMGQEQTPDDFVAALVPVFREVRRVLRDDGTLWLNIGDSYAARPRGSEAGLDKSGLHNAVNVQRAQRASMRKGRTFGDAKHKDLLGIPWMLAFALRADGWWLRQEIIWHKPNPMPESVEDRCTKAHESLFLLSKSERYYFDQEAISEPAARGDRGSSFVDGQTGVHQLGRARGRSGNLARKPGTARGCPEGTGSNVCGSVPWEGDTRNKRSVWTVSTVPYRGAHFATFPPKLVEPCILAGCPIGGTVLDPFGGVGTTGLVADRLQRDAILIELNSEHATAARARIDDDRGPLLADAAVRAVA